MSGPSRTENSDRLQSHRATPPSQMAAVLTPQPASTSSSPSPTTLPPSVSPPSNQSIPALPPLMTSPPSVRTAQQRAPSYANKRLSTFSSTSANSNNNVSRSRPQSSVFPLFHSSLPYTLVRDFAYPTFHALHYGPAPEEPSGISTPASEVNRRLSDPAPNWDGPRVQWAAWGNSDEQLPQTSFGDDGPPWSEDEDLHSPVVRASGRHHKKHKSHAGYSMQERGRSRQVDAPVGRRASYAGTNGDGSQTYYFGDPADLANGPGGEYITYPPNSQQRDSYDDDHDRRDSHFAMSTLPKRTYASNSADYPDLDSSGSDAYDYDDDIEDDEEASRYSRTYHFTIASPDEEMHGKAVALFDFARENENELPLVEGQVILVSYRHGQGWLVAQDPKTGESGLVPEEYVRLLRDIEGGWGGMTDGESPVTRNIDEVAAADPAKTPTQTQGEHLSLKHSSLINSGTGPAHGRSKSERDGEYYTPVVSTFSTSSRDLQPWPQHLLGSQASTPVAGSFARRGSEESSSRSRSRGNDEVKESDTIEEGEENEEERPDSKGKEPVVS